MNNQELFVIDDLNGYSTQMRSAAAQHIKAYSFNNLDNYVTLNQVIQTVIENSRGYDDQDRVIVRTEDHENIFNQLVMRLYHTSLCKMASKDEIQCAWNNETNIMEFWINECS
jgi:hypothetical protein